MQRRDNSSGLGEREGNGAIDGATNGLSNALDLLDEGFALFDGSMRLVAWNSRFEKLRDFPSQLCRPGVTLLELIRFSADRGDYGPGDPETLAADFLDEISRSGARDIRSTLSGDRIIHAKYRSTDDGKLIVTYSDVTDFRQAEAEVENSHQLLVESIESISEGFVLFDAEDRLVITNSVYREYFKELSDMVVPGTTFEAIVRAALDRGMFPNAKGQEEHWLEQVMTRRAVASGPREQFLHNELWLRITDHRLSDGGLVSVYSDISDLKSREMELEKARANLSRYFSPNLVEELARKPDMLDGPAERRDLTFVFTDVAEFTSLIESLAPQTVAPLLNEYVACMTEIVFNHGGTVDKIVGDAVHAIFGAPLAQEDQADRALACAYAMDTFCEDFRESMTKNGIPLGITRIGVHSGTAIVGNFGGKSYFDFTAHGDAVNTAARLEAANKVLGTRICVSDATRQQAPRFNGRPVGFLKLKGKNQKIAAFELLAEHAHSAESIADYLQAFNKLSDGDAQASRMFAAYVAKHGEDPLAVFHLQRSLAGELGVDIEIP